MGKRSTKPGYAVLDLPAVYSLTYQVRDLFYQQVPVATLYMERLKDRWIIHMKDAWINGVSVEITDFIKRSAKQGRVRVCFGIEENRPARVCRTLRRSSLKKCISMNRTKARMISMIFKYSIKITADSPKSVLYFCILLL